MDSYTKFILTVIAICLAFIAVKLGSDVATAQGLSCGSSSMRPCYIEFPISSSPCGTSPSTSCYVTISR